jgi:hypothetical protein
MCNMYKIRIKYYFYHRSTHARGRCINDYRISVMVVRTNSNSKSVCVNVDDEFDDF